jgi:hypothetical protein
MTIEAWLAAATADARARGLDDLPRLLETLAQATAALRQADWTPDAAADPGPSTVEGEPPTPAREPA